MLEVDLGQLGRPLGAGSSPGRRVRRRSACSARARSKLSHVAARHRRPAHVAPVGGGALAEGEPLRVVAEQADDLARDRRRVPPGDEDPAPVGEELARVEVGRGDDGLARARPRRPASPR